MADNTFKYIKYENGLTHISDNAFNYDVIKENIDKKYQTIFEHYDTNEDNTLDSSELSILKNDIDEANSDNEKYNLNKQEAKSLLNKIFPDKKIKTRVLNGCLNALQKSYLTTIETESDGIIDNFNQGDQGNCWLLTGIKSLSRNEWGAKTIKDSICDNKANKTYTVRLRGANFECTITYDEIREKESQTS